jgi:hypothetical protein
VSLVVPILPLLGWGVLYLVAREPEGLP